LSLQLAVASIQQIFGVPVATIHRNTKPTMKYTEVMHFMILNFHVFGVSWLAGPLLDAISSMHRSHWVFTCRKL